jgi:hypothetical protein
MNIECMICWLHSYDSPEAFVRRRDYGRMTPEGQFNRSRVQSFFCQPAKDPLRMDAN